MSEPVPQSRPSGLPRLLKLVVSATVGASLVGRVGAFTPGTPPTKGGVTWGPTREASTGARIVTSERFRESNTRQKWSSSGGILEAPQGFKLPQDTVAVIESYVSDPSTVQRRALRTAKPKVQRAGKKGYKLSHQQEAMVKAVQRAAAAINLRNELTKKFNRAPTRWEWAAALGVTDQTLVKVIGQGAKARAGLVLSMKPLVNSMLRKYYGAHTPSVIKDLAEEAYLGIIKAAQGYDPAKGAFSTYAYFYIHKNIAAAAADYSSVAITGPTERQALKDLQRAEQALMKQLDDAPTASEMATALNWPVEKVLDMWRRGRPLQSMESGVYNTALHGVGDTLADPAPWSVEVDASAADLQEAVLRSVSKLGEEERMVLVYRLGLVDGQRRSWDELLQLMGGRTVAYLRKVESRAKKQLMRDMEFCKLAERLAPLELELV